ncbi:AAA family ATPase [Herbidospora sp. NEAU-GS84]|uniref:AAA family ATPase n=1 Tax=Herbidospora solisilvae TaxID=2696284 RepID=A0A7C9J6T3_9ACTN|nr:LuxR family transcriptional regulator [Herbidospora solisilvae]NAS25965.1 AAA family ATPase [Herbidospora solisilvae]
MEREAELAALENGVRGIRAGGRMILLSGAAGVGKSTLLSCLNELAGTHGCRRLTARGTALEHTFSFGIVRQLFEGLVVGASVEAEARDELFRGAARPARSLFVRSDEGAETDEVALLEGLHGLVANLCAGRPLILQVDDLHWADTASLRFLTYLLPRLPRLPLLLVAATRPEEPGSDVRLLPLLSADPDVQVLRPEPLTEQATGLLIGERLGPADDVFVAACHQATAGNPLLLHELGSLLIAEGTTPVDANAARVRTDGARAVQRWVDRRMAALPGPIADFARAAALLGDDAPFADACHVAGMERGAGEKAVRTLAALEILQLEKGPAPGRPSLRFVHPLVHAAIYDSLGVGDRHYRHLRAARLLARHGSPDERVAAHLLLAPPAGEPWMAQVLDRAAQAALREGSPGSALEYLQRLLREPLPAPRRSATLMAAASAAMNVDLGTAVVLLEQASAVADAPDRALMFAMWGYALWQLGDVPGGAALYRKALEEVTDPDGDLARQAQACLLQIANMLPGRDETVTGLRHLWHVVPDDSVGGRMLEWSIAFHDMTVCEPGAVGRARRAFVSVADRRDGGPGDERAAGPLPLLAGHGWLVLMAADSPEIESILDDYIRSAERSGSLRDLGPALLQRAYTRLKRADLPAAEADMRTAQQLMTAVASRRGIVWINAYLIDILLEQGRTENATSLAETDLTSFGPPDAATVMFQERRARLLRRIGRLDAALEEAVLAGRYWAGAGVTNPAFTLWRGEAARCLHLLGRTAEATEHATEQLRLARRWGAPGALGEALRLHGTIASGASGLLELEEAVDLLSAAPQCRLPYAKALFDLGSALRRSGHRVAARRRLTEALDVAAPAGLAPLAVAAKVELRATGAAPSAPQTDAVKLTASEWRIAEMAAEGRTNRAIAHLLFVSAKTVEVHLSSAYRKLGINGRAGLKSALRSLPPAE